MDAFEEIVAGLFRQNGFWVRQSYKVNLTKPEKVEIGKPSTPRPEIDILAYSPCGNSGGKLPTYSNMLVEENTLLWVECKSYLDSFGVAFSAFGNVEDASNPGASSGFKLFTDERYREVLSRKLVQQVVKEGLTLPNPCLQYCLVAGHTYPSTREKLHQYFEQKNWKLFDEYTIKEQLKSLSQQLYENDVVMIVAKLFEKTKEK